MASNQEQVTLRSEQFMQKMREKLKSAVRRGNQPKPIRGNNAQFYGVLVDVYRGKKTVTDKGGNKKEKDVQDCQIIVIDPTSRYEASKKLTAKGGDVRAEIDCENNEVRIHVFYNKDFEATKAKWLLEPCVEEVRMPESDTIVIKPMQRVQVSTDNGAPLQAGQIVSFSMSASAWIPKTANNEKREKIKDANGVLTVAVYTNTDRVDIVADGRSDGRLFKLFRENPSLVSKNLPTWPEYQEALRTDPGFSRTWFLLPISANTASDFSMQFVGSPDSPHGCTVRSYEFMFKDEPKREYKTNDNTVGPYPMLELGLDMNQWPDCTVDEMDSSLITMYGSMYDTGSFLIFNAAIWKRMCVNRFFGKLDMFAFVQVKKDESEQANAGEGDTQYALKISAPIIDMLSLLKETALPLSYEWIKAANAEKIMACGRPPHRPAETAADPIVNITEMNHEQQRAFFDSPAAKTFAYVALTAEKPGKKLCAAIAAHREQHGFFPPPGVAGFELLLDPDYDNDQPEESNALVWDNADPLPIGDDHALKTLRPSKIAVSADISNDQFLGVFFAIKRNILESEMPALIEAPVVKSIKEGNKREYEQISATVEDDDAVSL